MATNGDEGGTRRLRRRTLLKKKTFLTKQFKLVTRNLRVVSSEDNEKNYKREKIMKRIEI